ncbi:hypothetical protein F4778DRAFT_316289 [Xylariomycetidae sp. FL2044]|nr:hypothetical protein F4778DRAFT_316289 [Xylariomycetidae sp. FL2044]
MLVIVLTQHSSDSSHSSPCVRARLMRLRRYVRMYVPCPATLRTSSRLSSVERCHKPSPPPPNAVERGKRAVVTLLGLTVLFFFYQTVRQKCECIRSTTTTLSLCTMYGAADRKEPTALFMYLGIYANARHGWAPLTGRIFSVYSACGNNPCHL